MNFSWLVRAMRATRRNFAQIGVIGWLLSALVVSSTVESARLETLVGSFQISHLLTFALAVAVPFSDPLLRRITFTSVIFLTVFSASAIPSILSFQETSRLFPILQLGMNLLTLIVSIGLARRLRDRLPYTIAALTLLLSILALIQVVVAPTMSSGEEPRLLGIPRPTLWFEEPTWLALMFSLLCAAAFQLRLKWAGAALLAIVVVMWTRTATVIAVAATLIQVRVEKSLRFVIVAMLIVAPIVGGGLVLWVIGSPNLPVEPSSSSIVTRIWDIWTVSQANNGQFWPWGGAKLDVYDTGRSRQVPLTSNVFPFELMWKYGLPGLGMVLLTSAFFIVLPGIATGKFTWSVMQTPAGIGFALVPVTFILSNAMGRPSMWVTGGLVIAALIQSVVEDQQPHREPKA